MFGVYKKLLYYVPKQRPLAYFAIGLTVVSTLLNVGAYYYLKDVYKRQDMDSESSPRRQRILYGCTEIPCPSYNLPCPYENSRR